MRVIKPCISDEIMNKSEIISSAQKNRDNSLSLSISLSLSHSREILRRHLNLIRNAAADSALCEFEYQVLMNKLCSTNFGIVRFCESLV